MICIDKLQKNATIKIQVRRIYKRKIMTDII